MPVVNKQTTKPQPKKSGSAVDRISPIEFGDDGLKILLYGRSGTGKTTLWATFPGPILALVCSGGNKPGELRSVNTPELRKKIQTVNIESSKDIAEIVDYQGNENKFKTIVLDHASGMQDKVLAEILGLERLPAQMGWGVATQQQYGQCTLVCKEYLRGLLGLSCNVVIVAQEREFNNEGASDILLPFVGAALSPSLTGWLNPACDYVCQTFIRQVEVEKQTMLAGKPGPIRKEKVKGQYEFCLRTGHHDVYTTKFRVPKGKPLPEVVVDPSYNKIVELING